MTGQTTTGRVREYHLCSPKYFLLAMYSYVVVCFLCIALVSGVSVVSLSSTSVMVSWTPVNLTVVHHYTVHYTTVGGVNGTVLFPATSLSSVVPGLQGGETYWFSVSVTLNVSGGLFSRSSNDTLPPAVTCKLPIVTSMMSFILASIAY